MLASVRDVSEAVGWLKSTFYYQRKRTGALDKHGHLTEPKQRALDKELRLLVMGSLHELADLGCVAWEEDCYTVKTTQMGRIMQARQPHTRRGDGPYCAIAYTYYLYTGRQSAVR